LENYHLQKNKKDWKIFLIENYFSFKIIIIKEMINPIKPIKDKPIAETLDIVWNSFLDGLDKSFQTL